MRRDEERLSDILDAADRIRSRVAEGRSAFDADEDRQLAIVRLIEIVGEACAGVSEDMRTSHEEVPWRAAASMRNRVIHGYFDIDLDLVWAAAEREVPELAARVRLILDEPGSQSRPDEPSGMVSTAALDDAMREVYVRAKNEAGYNATDYLQMLSQQGGLGTAKRLLASNKLPSGFVALWERRRLDLTVENVVLRPEFAEFFTDEELEVARNRLRDYGVAVD